MKTWHWAVVAFIVIVAAVGYYLNTQTQQADADTIVIGTASSTRTRSH